MLFKLALEALAQGKCVSCRPGKSDDYVAARKHTYLTCIGLEDGLSMADLPVASNYDLSILAHRDDRSPVPTLIIVAQRIPPVDSVCFTDRCATCGVLPLGVKAKASVYSLSMLPSEA